MLANVAEANHVRINDLWKVVKFVLFLLFSIPTIRTAVAGVNEWTSELPPIHDQISDFYLDPSYSNTIYSWQGYPMVSHDDGMTWSALVDPGSFLDEDGKMTANAIEPFVLYYAVSESITDSIQRYHFYRSFDRGLSWDLVFTSEPGSTELRGFSAHPYFSTIVFYSLFDTLSETASSFMRSTDCGATWSQCLPDTRFLKLGYTKSDVNIIYSLDNMVLRSNNAGESWEELTNISFGMTPHEIFVSKTNSDHVYIGFNGNPSSCVRTLDGFLTWDIWGPGGQPNLYTMITAIWCDKSEMHFALRDDYNAPLLSRLWMSSDGGITWRISIDNMDNRINRFMLHIKDRDSEEGVIYGDGCGLFKSTDFGVNWSNQTLTRWTLAQINPRQHRTRYLVSCLSGFWRSSDSGNTWQPSMIGLSDLALQSVSIDAVDNDALLLPCDTGAPFISRDGGLTWKRTSYSGFDDAWDYSVKFSETVSGRIWAILGYRGFEPDRLHISEDYGETWRELVLPLHLHIQDINEKKVHTDHLYLLTTLGKSSNLQLHISESMGETWREVSLSEDVPVSLHNERAKIREDHNREGVVYIGAMNLLQSFDSGETWTVNTATSYCGSIQVDPNQSGVLYTAFQSENDGFIWSDNYFTNTRLLIESKNNIYNTSYEFMEISSQEPILLLAGYGLSRLTHESVCDLSVIGIAQDCDVNDFVTSLEMSYDHKLVGIQLYPDGEYPASNEADLTGYYYFHKQIDLVDVESAIHLVDIYAKDKFGGASLSWPKLHVKP